MKKLICLLICAMTLAPAAALAAGPERMTELYSGTATYIDDETLTSFTIPKGWYEIDVPEVDTTSDAYFRSSRDENMIICYASINFWNTMAESERSGYERSDFDNSVFTKAQVASLLELSENQISTASYGDNEYYVITANGADGKIGLSADIDVKAAIRVYDGYVYIFMISDDDSSGVFEAMLNSVTYIGSDSLSSAYGEDSTGETPVGNAGSSESEFLFNSVLIIIAVYSAFVIFYRFAIRKTPELPQRAIWIAVGFGTIICVASLVVLQLLNKNLIAAVAVIPWSFAVYWILTSGYRHSEAGKETFGFSAGAGENRGFNAGEGRQSGDQDGAFGYERSAAGCENGEESPEQYCSACGNKLFPGSVFCDRCGKKTD